MNILHRLTARLPTADLIAAILAAGIAVFYVGFFLSDPRWFNFVFALLSFILVFSLLWLQRAIVPLAAVNLGVLGGWAVVCFLLYPANTGIPPNLLVAPWVIFNIGRTQSARVLWWFVVACLIGSFASPARWIVVEVGVLGPRSTMNFLVIITLHWLIIAVAALWGRSRQLKDITFRHEIEQQQQQERTLIAAEIHDVLAHSLTLIRVQAAAGLVAPETAAESLRNIQQISGEGITEVRAIITALAQGGIAVTETSSLTDLIRQFEQNGLRINAEICDFDTLSPVIQLALYRLASECLTNSLKHQRKPVQVIMQISSTDTDIIFDYHSSGSVISSSSSGFGLVGLHERCITLGGSFDYEIRASSASVHARLPMKGIS